MTTEGMIMSNKRSRFEICVDILEAIYQGNSKPTKIMYNVRIGWKPLCSMLGSLESQELIENIPVSINDRRTKVMYRITKKGRNVLEYYNKARTLFTTDPATDIELIKIVRQ